MSKFVLQAQPRSVQAKKARHLRVEGFVPAIAYGPGKAPVPLMMEEKGLDATLRQAGQQMLEVHVSDGTMHNVMVREIQRNPLNHRPLHVDFYLPRMDVKQQVSVQLVAAGKPDALVSGMMVLQTHESIEIEALPADIPAFIEVDITRLSEEHPITVKDLPAVAGITYLGDPDAQLISLVAAQAGLEEEAPAAEGEESAEPEVVKKGKSDEDEE